MKYFWLACFLAACAPYEIRRPTDSPAPLESILYFSDVGFSCTAVAIESHVAATAGHCVDKMTSAPHLTRLNGRTVDVVSAWRSPAADLALIRTEEDLSPAKLNSELPSVLDKAYVAGYGCDSELGARVLGIRSVTYFGLESDHKFKFGGRLCYGDSGGAVVSEDGRLWAISVSLAPNKPEFFAEPIAGIADGLLSDVGWVSVK